MGRFLEAAAGRDLKAVLCPGDLVSAVGRDAGAGRNHRRGSFVNCADGLGVVDPTEVGGGDAEVGMSELPLDDATTLPARRLDHVDRSLPTRAVVSPAR